jgi:hypothetical protein
MAWKLRQEKRMGPIGDSFPMGPILFLRCASRLFQGDGDAGLLGGGGGLVGQAEAEACI